MANEWEKPSPQVAELIVAGVARIVDPPPQWLDEINAAVLSAVQLDDVLSDEVMVATLLQTNATNLQIWAQSNLRAPGERVPVEVGDASEMIHEIVRRGVDPGVLDTFRTAQAQAWRRWMTICFDLTDDVGLLRELLDVTSQSISAFIDDTVELLAGQIAAARAQLAGDTHAERRATVALVLEGAPIADARASAQLNYRLSGPHVAAVVSGGPGTSAGRLEAAVDAVAAIGGVTRRLTVVAGATTLWVWFPVAELVIEASPADFADVRIALGRAGTGREGFRRSHFQALAVEGLLAASERGFADYDEVALVAALARDPAAAEDFVAETLGDLAGADEELRTCMRAWFAHQCNAQATAAALFTHRNTVVRRIARAASLLPVPLSRNAVNVAAALEYGYWRG